MLVCVCLFVCVCVCVCVRARISVWESPESVCLSQSLDADNVFFSQVASTSLVTSQCSQYSQ